MEYLFVLSVILTVVVAVHKNRSVAGWLVLGVLFGVFALIAVTLLPKKEICYE